MSSFFSKFYDNITIWGVIFKKGGIGMVNSTNGKLLNQIAIFFTLFTLLIYVLGFFGITQKLLPGQVAIYLQYTSLALAILLTFLGKGKELSNVSFKILAIGFGGLALFYFLIPILWALNAKP